MSFSSHVKEELCRIRVKPPQQRLSELSGLTLTCGTLRISKGLGIVYSSESLAVGKRILALAGTLYEPDATIELLERERHRTPLTTVTLSGAPVEKLLLDTGALSLHDGVRTIVHQIPGMAASDEDCARAFLRGAFLGSGSCANPRRGYHLEIVTTEKDFCEDICRRIRHFSLSARRMQRKDKHIAYLKGDDVAGYLALIGANQAALETENVRTEKEFRNYVNRRSNCETANIGKTVDAGLMQLRAIETIEQAMRLESLPTPLYEAARLRMQHPDATLQELADMAEIGKSGMNHRLTRLLRLAEEIQHG